MFKSPNYPLYESRAVWVLAIAAALYLYPTSPGRGLLFVIVTRLTYGTIVTVRAQKLLSSLKSDIESYERPDYEILEFDRFPEEAKHYFEKFAGQIVENGYKPLVSYRNRSFGGGEGELNCSTIYTGDDGQDIFSLTYLKKAIVQPVLFPVVTFETISARLIESHLVGAGRIITTDYELAEALGQREHFYVRIVPKQTAVSELCRIHSEHVQEVLSTHQYQRLQITTPEQLFARENEFRQVTAKEQKADYEKLIEENNLECIAPE